MKSLQRRQRTGFLIINWCLVAIRAMSLKNTILLVSKQLRVVRMARRGRHERSEVVNKGGTEEANKPSCLEKAQPSRVLEFDCVGGNEETRYIMSEIIDLATFFG
jgi:hypothetical protein